MRTPAEYTKNLKSGIVTTEMMRDALFSVNKRAKNYRDAERKARAYSYSRVDYSASSRGKKEELYHKKEFLLSQLTPVCIHREFAGYKRTRVFSYQKDYDRLWAEQALMDRIVWANSYMDWESYLEVYFFDYVTNSPEYRYYLYYVCGDQTFHSPIEESDVKKYAKQYGLSIETINELHTQGDEVTDLLSLQFVNKMIKAFEDKTVAYKKTIDDCPPVFDNSVPDFDTTHCLTKDDLKDIIGEMASDIDSKIRSIKAGCHPDDSMRVELAKSMMIKQKRDKKGILSRPKIKIREFKYITIFQSNVFVDHAYDILINISNGHDRYERLLELMLSPDSPVYKDLIIMFCEEKLYMSVRNKLLKDVHALYRKDNTRRIVNKNGVVMFKDQSA